MSEFINIAAHQTLGVPLLDRVSDVAQEPDTVGLKKHFLAVFSKHTGAKAFVVKPRKGHYQLRLDRAGLFYSETAEGCTKKIEYEFKEDQILLNGMPQPPFFLKKFMSRLREISGDVVANSATIYEEVLR